MMFLRGVVVKGCLGVQVFGLRVPNPKPFRVWDGGAFSPSPGYRVSPRPYPYHYEGFRVSLRAQGPK